MRGWGIHLAIGKTFLPLLCSAILSCKTTAQRRQAVGNGPDRHQFPLTSTLSPGRADRGMQMSFRAQRRTGFADFVKDAESKDVDFAGML